MDREQVRAMVERQARAWMDADYEAIVADYAPDGILSTPGGTWQGREAIRGAAAAFYESAGAVEVSVQRVLLDGDQGAVEWTWSETARASGRRVTMEDAIVFVLRDGQIAYWREYFDTAPLRAVEGAETA